MDETCERSVGRRPQCKMKSYLMERFFNEPVDALDKRLKSAENYLNWQPIDPFTEVKQEEVDPDELDHPLDYSEVQVASPVDCPVHPYLHSDRCTPDTQASSPTPPIPIRDSRSQTPSYSPTYSVSCSFIQRVTIQTSPQSSCLHPGPDPTDSLL